MKTAVLSVLTAIAFPLVLAMGAGPALAQGGDCLAPNAIQQAIQAGEIQSWAAVRRMAGIPPGYSEVSGVQVCRRGGQLYYIVSVVTPSGEARRLALNAVDGSQ
jgi:hypothetical protein